MNSAARIKLDDYISWSVMAFEHYQKVRDSDALTNTRKAGEACCKFLLYQKYDTKIDERIRKFGYKELIDLLIEKNIAPRKVINWLETIQIYGNLATHDNKVDSVQAEYGYNALKLLTEWLFIEELKHSIPARLHNLIKPKPNEDKLKQQIDSLKNELQNTKKQSEKIKRELGNTQDVLKTKPDSENDLKRDLESALEKVKQLETSNEKIKQLEEQLKTTLSEAQVIKVIKEQLENKAVAEIQSEPIIVQHPIKESLLKKHSKKITFTIITTASIFLFSLYFFTKNKTIVEKSSKEISREVIADDSIINILVSPLAIMQDNPNISFKIEDAFINELKSQAQDQKVNVAVIYNPKDKPVTLLTDAIELGKKQNSQIVFYGEVFEKANADTVNLSIKYVFIHPEEYNQHEMKGELETKYFTNLTDANFNKLKNEIQYLVTFISISKLQKEKKWSEILTILDKTKPSVKWAQYNAGTFKIRCFTEMKKYNNLLVEGEKNYKIYPDSAFAKMDLAFIYGSENIKRFSDARKLIEDILKQYPDNQWYLVNYAGLLDKYFVKDSAIARKAINRCLNKHPEYCNCWLEKGMQYNTDSKYAEAVKCFDKATMLDPKNPEPIKMLIGIYSDFMDNAKTLYYSDMLLKIDSTNVDALFRKANAYYNTGQYDNALSYSEKVIKMIESYPDKKHYAAVYAILGLCKFQMDDKKNSKILLQTSLQLDSNQVLARETLVVIFVSEKNYDAAYKLIMYSYRHNPTDSRTCYNLSQFYTMVDNKKYYNESKCEEMLKKGYKLNPKDTLFLEGLGTYYFSVKKDYKNSLKYFNEWVMLNPNSYDGNRWIGAINIQTNDILKARKFCQKSIEVNPNGFQAYANLGLTYLHDPGFDVQKAYNLTEKSIIINPQYGEGYLALAKILLEEDNNCEEVKANYNKALTINPALKNLDFEGFLNARCK
jgi:tetratricopeptide (TPR) repeat protein